MKPNIFSVTGKSHQIEAIMKDFEELGYEVLNKKALGEMNIVSIGTNNSEPRDLNTFKTLCIFKPGLRFKTDIRFNLPEEYFIALEYAKTSIENHYWSASKYNINDWVKIKDDDEDDEDALIGYITEIPHPDRFIISDVNKDRFIITDVTGKKYPIGPRVSVIKLTDDEVFTYLKIEAVKRNYANERFSFSNDLYAGCTLLCNGKVIWSTIKGWNKSSKRITLHFGDVKFIITNSEYAITNYGKVTKEELKTAIDFINRPTITLAGYPLTVGKEGEEELYNLSDIYNSEDLTIGFGCKAGTSPELENIYEAMCKF